MLTALHVDDVCFSFLPKSGHLCCRYGLELRHRGARIHVESKACLLLTDRCFCYFVPCHGPAVGNMAVSSSLLNLLKPCKLLAVVNLGKEEGM